MLFATGKRGVIDLDGRQEGRKRFWFTDSGKYGKRALKTGLVERTWSNILAEEDSLPPEWWKGGTGVLVGIEPVRIGDEDVSETSWSNDDTSES